jgi:hypothetical protein
MRVYLMKPDGCVSDNSTHSLCLAWYQLGIAIRATVTACTSITGESTCDLLGKNSKLRLVAINRQHYCNGRKTRNRKVHMTATLRRRAEQNVGGVGAPTSIFRRRRRNKIFGGAARPA